MHRYYQSDYSCPQNHRDIKHQTAFHEAGHAASIYLGNRQKQLPPVFFKIQIQHTDHSDNQFFAKVIDGRLIQNLPIVGLDSTFQLTEKEQLSYQCAYEADIINLLVGSLAEARYVSERDNEDFNFYLLNTHALNYYGGSSDINEAYSYLEYLMPSKIQQEEKMQELFIQAFQFIEENENWNCILKLAQYILKSENNSVSCEEAIEVFNTV